jgi:hypothetical protein
MAALAAPSPNRRLTNRDQNAFKTAFYPPENAQNVRKNLQKLTHLDSPQSLKPLQTQDLRGFDSQIKLLLSVMCVSVAQLLVLGTAARADQLTLTDGRTFTGEVATEGTTVSIKMPYGTMSFDKNMVLKIEASETPQAKLDKKLVAITDDNPDALFAVAQWAIQNNLSKQAQEIYARILKIDPDHGATRKELEQIKVDGQWRTFDQALELCRSKLEAGDTDALKKLLPALQQTTANTRKLPQVAELMGLVQLRTRDFAAAATTFADLATKADAPLAIQAGAIASLLKDNADGMYMLDEAYPPASSVLDSKAKSLKAGPVSLADPLALQAALHNKAKKEVLAGKAFMDEALKLQLSDPDGAKAKTNQAVKCFDNADALVDNISRSWRIEIARRRIAAIRKDTDADAKKFDTAKEDLGKQDLTAEKYKAKLQRLVHHLDNVRDGLKEIINIAQPYSRELVLEIKWAQADLKTIEDMRSVLTAELNGES